MKFRSLGTIDPVDLGLKIPEVDFISLSHLQYPSCVPGIMQGQCVPLETDMFLLNIDPPVEWVYLPFKISESDVRKPWNQPLNLLVLHLII
jgi:hypothetical protein